MTTVRRAAFVTGASHGFGAAIARALVQDGFDLALSATRIENLSDILAELAPSGAKLVLVALDQSAMASVEAAMATVIDAFGQLDVLINNAAVPLNKAATEVTEDEWDKVMRTNLTGPFFLSQIMARNLIAAGRPGCIVNLSSTHGIVALSRRSAYGISKAALIHMPKMLAIEWAEHGIRVNAVAPGAAETHSRAALLADPDFRKSMLDRIPLGRFATEDEVAGAVLYLVNPRASYITGQTIVLDGGLTVY
jgi:NAD(P)-dependent dehydrogenase (short-subunit alcohol dehydrogenase family)